jgi:hypothetical protein
MKNTIATRLNRDDYNRLVKYCISNNIDKAEFVRMAILTNLNAVMPKIDDENSHTGYSHQLSNEDIKSIIAELVDQKVTQAIEAIADQDYQLKDRIFDLEVNLHDLQANLNFKLETMELKHERFKEDFIKQSFLNSSTSF